MSELNHEAWLVFYRPFFDSDNACAAFVAGCVAQSGSLLNSKIIMHQVRRLTMLADDSLELRPGRYSLGIFWLIVCAEAVAKLYTKLAAEGESRKMVHIFFDTFLTQPQKDLLGTGILSMKSTLPMGLRGAVDALYDVRCDVAHEGNYWDWTFTHKGTPMLNPDYDVIADLEWEEFRDLVVRGGVVAARSLWAPTP